MKEIFVLINSMAPFLLLGFLLAGILHAFVPRTLYSRYIGKNNFRSVINATLLGIPLPLCSCGVIPTAMSLRKEGASQGATAAFLIATPQTGIDSMIATYSLMGLPFALLRPLVALLTSLLGGCLVNAFTPATGPCQPSSQPTANPCSQPQTFGQKLQAALHYAFVEMMQDIGKWLVMGLLVAGLITAFVPNAFFATFADQPFLSMLLVLAFSIPMYLCATGSIPIAVALMLKGLSPGTALVLLMAGPAVNVASMLIISKVMGKKTLILYLTSIISGAIFFGLCMDYLLPREWFTQPLVQMQAGHDTGISYFQLGSFMMLTVLLIHAFIQRYKKPATCCCQTAFCSCHQEDNDANQWTVVVKGMTCHHCKSNVEKAILQVEGVTQVSINLSDGSTLIRGHIEKEAIRKAVASIGFEIVE